MKDYEDTNSFETCTDALKYDIHNSLKDLGAFKCSKILRDDPSKKVVALAASVEGSEEPAVIVLEKSAFSESAVKEMLDSETSVQKTFHNDIYGNYTGFPRQELNGLKVTIIHPASEKHLEKYSTQESFLVNETPELYSGVLLEYLKESSFNMQWVYNILEHRSEAERIVYEDDADDTGFVLLPDLKWDGVTAENLYLVALVRRRDLRSLRDLRQHHLPLLQNVWDSGTAAIERRYGVPASQLRVYLHYQPSYYHLHVHFTAVRFEAPGSHVGKAHLLQEVMANIGLMGDYYARATLCYFVRAGSALADRYCAAGYTLQLPAAPSATAAGSDSPAERGVKRSADHLAA